MFHTTFGLVANVIYLYFWSFVIGKSSQMVTLSAFKMISKQIHSNVIC